MIGLLRLVAFATPLMGFGQAGSFIDPYKVVEDYARLEETRRQSRSVRTETNEPDDCDKYEGHLREVLGLPTQSAINGSALCSAEIQEIDWNKDGTPDVLLHFDNAMALFVKTPRVFQYVGFVDDYYSKYTSPEARVIQFGNETFLQTKSGSGGSGAANYMINWYEVTPRGGRSVFSYSTEGKSVGEGLSREWDCSIEQIDAGAATVVASLNISFFIWHTLEARGELLFRKERRAAYHWNPNSREFQFDPARSTLGTHELENVFDYESSLPGFLDWYYPDLLTVARKGTASQRLWLRSWLKSQSPSLKKQQLLKTLR